MQNNDLHKIIIACDHEEAQAFVDWLNTQGYEAQVGRDTGNYIDGVWTSSDPDVNEKMNDLWDRYCNGY